MLTQFQHQSQSEKICCGEVINLATAEHCDIVISPGQLRQLLSEGLVHPQTAYNNQPTFEEFLKFADCIAEFLQEDKSLLLRFKGLISRPLSETANLEVMLSEFELRHLDENQTLERAIEMLTSVVRFISQKSADDFKLYNQAFWARWD